MTLHDQICRGLDRLGYPREAGRSAKYTTFSDPTREGRRVFVGRLGAVRVGRIATQSIPSDGLKQRALSVGCGEK